MDGILSPQPSTISSSPPAISQNGQPQYTHNPQKDDSPPRDLLLKDVISESFTPFDHYTEVVGPFENETARDVSFEQELSARLLTALLETHAWATTRPKVERRIQIHSLEDKISQIMETEKKQGMCLSASLTTSTPSFLEKTREKLGAFVRHIKIAIEALTAAAL